MVVCGLTPYSLVGRYHVSEELTASMLKVQQDSSEALVCIHQITWRHVIEDRYSILQLSSSEMHSETESQLHTFSVSALDAGEWSVSSPGRFIPLEDTSVPIKHGVGRPHF
jgi:hypothetical protein